MGAHARRRLPTRRPVADSERPRQLLPGRLRDEHTKFEERRTERQPCLGERCSNAAYLAQTFECGFAVMVFLAEIGSEARHDGTKQFVAGSGVGLDGSCECGTLLPVQVVIGPGNEREEVPRAALQRFPIRLTETRLVITHVAPTLNQ